MNISELKRVVKELLQTKKYIVVFDDVWQPTHWDAIHLAFPRNQFGSRIVITTRNKDVGQAPSTSEAGCSVYLLSPLNDEKSMLLFCRKAFPDGTSCPQHLEQICEKILGTCKGLPLAIEVIGSNLARRSQRTEEWELFYKRLGVEMERNDQLDVMTKLLSLSYHDLPLHLKNCFLYLSIFPEDTEIEYDVLAQLWIGEGFVERISGMTPEEVAKSYLNELVDRCLVQVVATYNTGDVEEIRVHDILRHIIVLKAREHNIATVFDGQEGISFQNNVRRLSVQGSINGYPEQGEDYCKSIRTLYLCGKVGGHIPEKHLSSLLSHSQKLVKVLDLESAQLERIPYEIFKLFHLKYLNLRSTNVSFVPKSIGMLQSLEFLNLLGTGVTQLPVEILKLQHLRHILTGIIYQQYFVHRFDDIQGVRASFRIGSLKFLQKLYFIEADEVDNMRVVTEIGKLIHLRVLGIAKLKREDGKELCSSLGNLKELRELYVYSVDEEVIDFQYCKSSDLPQLQSLVLVGRLEKCPKFISSLNRLTTVKLRYNKLSDDPLKCLHDLPNLITLTLTAAYQGKSLCFKAGGFPKLKELYLYLLEELRWVVVEENALRSLQHLRMRDCQSMEEIPTGFEYLTRIQDLEFSNMSNEFVNKLNNLDKQSAAYKRLIQIPKVANATWSDGRWSKLRRFNKETGTFNNV